MCGGIWHPFTVQLGCLQVSTLDHITKKHAMYGMLVVDVICLLSHTCLHVHYLTLPITLS